MIKLHERMLPTQLGLNPHPPDHQSDAHPTEPPTPAQKRMDKKNVLTPEFALSEARNFRPKSNDGRPTFCRRAHHTTTHRDYKNYHIWRQCSATVRSIIPIIPVRDDPPVMCLLIGDRIPVKDASSFGTINHSDR